MCKIGNKGNDIHILNLKRKPEGKYQKENLEVDLSVDWILLAQNRVH